MRGDIIVVKDVSGNLLNRGVWEVTERGVYVHSEEEWNRRIRGEKYLDPVGFPSEDVYSPDENWRVDR
jgi:hypothetical protein